MPNLVQNKVIVKADKKTMLELLNIGLRNSELETEKDLEKAFSQLKENGNSLHSIFKYDKEFDGKPMEVERVKGVTMRTFLPMPMTFLKYDTTNRADKFPKESAEQRAKYGAVGWYDYNLNTLGTKWDAELENLELKVEKSNAYFTFECTTAWDEPREFFVNLNKLVGEKLKIAIKSVEEFCDFAYVRLIDKTKYNAKIVNFKKNLEIVAERHEDDDVRDDFWTDYNDEMENMDITLEKMIGLCTQKSNKNIFIWL